MRLKVGLICTLVIVFGCSVASAQQSSGAPSSAAPAAPTMGMTLDSAAFGHGALIPEKFTQSVTAPLSPPLVWNHVPEGVKSFALICEDLDAAPNKSPVGTLHWLVFNIPAESRGLAEGVPATSVLPDGTVQGLNQGRVVGWRGPGARWPGPHHNYAFVLYALDSKLDLGADATHAQVLEAMQGRVLAKAATVGRFHRNK